MCRRTQHTLKSRSLQSPVAAGRHTLGQCGALKRIWLAYGAVAPSDEQCHRTNATTCSTECNGLTNPSLVSAQTHF